MSVVDPDRLNDVISETFEALDKALKNNGANAIESNSQALMALTRLHEINE